jgi:hypothetical protein
MARRTLLATLVVLTALNLIVMIVNLSAPSKAAVSGLTYRDLVADSDFTRAVQSIVEACRVNVDTAKVQC